MSASLESLAYEKGYRSINGMLVDSAQSNFKDAVYYTENAFYGDSLSKDWFQEQLNNIKDLTIIHAVTNHSSFQYNKKDSSDILLHASLFNETIYS